MTKNNRIYSREIIGLLVIEMCLHNLNGRRVQSQRGQSKD